MEKLDIHGLEKRYEASLNRVKESKDISKRNKELLLQFLRDAELGKTIKNRAKKKVGFARLEKYAIYIKKLAIDLDKDLDKVTPKEMEDYIYNLERNKIKSYQKEANYSEASKIDIKMILIKFYKYLSQVLDKPELIKLIDWIDTSFKREEIPALSREEIEKLAEACNPMYKSLILLLFDSGARIEEFLNITLGDLTKKDDYYMLRIRYSKTKPRTISIPMYTTILENWLKMHPKKNDPSARLFDLDYDAIRMEFRRKGNRIIGKRVNPHLLRHSSATYYANKLSHFQMCNRYGWSMSSRMPSVYIDRNGIEEEKVAEIIQYDEISSVKKENKQLREDMELVKDSISGLDDLLPYFKAMIKNPKIKEFIKQEIKGK